jgi:hypothetical protein
MHIRLQLGSTLGPIGIHTCSDSDYLCVSVQASPILQICHLAQKTRCLGSHLPRPLVLLHTTMAKKAGKAAQGGGKGGGIIKAKAKGGTRFERAIADVGKAQKTIEAWNVSKAKALKSHTAWVKAIQETDKALARAKRSNKAVSEAVVKANKLKQCFELDFHEMRALEVR